MKKGDVYIALDFENEKQAVDLIDKFKGVKASFKVGKQLFTAAGPQFVRRLVKMNFDVFLDLKYHDIPNTVVAAVTAASDLGVKMVNVHASGGRKMMTAVAERKAKLGLEPLILAVTLLTSMADNDIAELGIKETSSEYVKRLAMLTSSCGLDGVVASPLEIELIRQSVVKSDFKILTPGIRPAGSDVNDQKRVATPVEAIKKGADFLVIGRPVTKAENPVETYIKIKKEIENYER